MVGRKDKPDPDEEFDPNEIVPLAPSKHANAQGPVPKPGEPLGVTMRTDPLVGKKSK